MLVRILLILILSCSLAFADSEESELPGATDEMSVPVDGSVGEASPGDLAACCGVTGAEIDFLAAEFVQAGKSVEDIIAEMTHAGASPAAIDAVIGEYLSQQGNTVPGFQGGTPEPTDPPRVTNPPDGKRQVRITFKAKSGYGSCAALLNANAYRWKKCAKVHKTINGVSVHRYKLWTKKIAPYFCYECYYDPYVSGE